MKTVIRIQSDTKRNKPVDMNFHFLGSFKNVLIPCENKLP